MGMDGEREREREREARRDIQREVQRENIGEEWKTAQLPADYEHPAIDPVNSEVNVRLYIVQWLWVNECGNK